ncbi:MAG: peptidase MA family metallohydrolase [Thermoanaerobaculaceae bacterium]
MCRLRLAALALAFSFGATAAAHPALEIEAPPGLEAAAARVRAATPDLAPVLELLGEPPAPARVRVVLAEESSELAARVPSWVAAYALPSLDTIVVFPARTPTYPDRNLPTLLAHELAHLLVFRASGGAPLPRWFEEGVATVAAREWGLEDGARFAAAVIGPGPESLAEVERAFTLDPGRVARSYALSAALVRYLLRLGGPDAVAVLLAQVRRGSTFEEAFLRTAGRPLDRFEADFFGEEVLWRTWVPFLSSTAALWMLITGLALVAIWRRRQRDAEMRARWAEEEVPPEPVPPENDPRRWN